MIQTISLAVESVVRRFGERLALDGMSFQLNRGEFLGLLGPNGAGKTTLIRAIAGRLRLDSGRVLIDSTPVVPGQKNSAIRRLGVIPQNIAIYEKLTARENLELFGRLYGVTPSDLASRVRETLDWIGLSDRADEPAGRFSGGMQRRLNIGCGVLHQPDLILLDEPTVGVDPQSRQKIWEMLKSIQHRGVSVLLTTHQLDEAQQVCDRIVIVDHGKTVAAGTFEQLLEQSVGRQRTVRLKTSGIVDVVPPGCVSKESGELSFDVSDIAAELPAMLRRITDTGVHIDDISIDVPSLQAVFLHFTGRELRES